MHHMVRAYWRTGTSTKVKKRHLEEKSKQKHLQEPLSDPNPAPNVPPLEHPLVELEACRTDFTNTEDGHQKNLQKILGHAALIAHAFKRNDEQWREFVKKPFWQETKKRYRPKRHETKRSFASFVIRYVLHAHNGALGQRAWKYGHVLDYLKAKGISPIDIPGELTKLGGIEEVHRMATEEMPRRQSSEAHEVDLSDFDDIVSDEGDNEGSEDEKSEFTVAGKPKRIAEALDLSSGRRAKLLVERTEDSDAEFQLIKVDPAQNEKERRGSGVALCTAYPPLAGDVMRCDSSRGGGRLAPSPGVFPRRSSRAGVQLATSSCLTTQCQVNRSCL